MRCPTCSHDNEPGARFCSQCGTRLELACPACATPYEAGDRFCSHCGTRLDGAPAEAAPAPGSAEPAEADLVRYVPEELLRKIRAAQSGQTMRGERRTVTMLFADVQGSTAAAEHLDPEEWADIINGAFGHLIAPIYRYEGTLARLQGDAILAFFGAPIAHEDDPVRAVHAGLDILAEIEPYRAEVSQRHGIDFAVRVGINTGLVVVGEVGSDLRVEYTALGDAINVAARMEQTADPGTLRVTHETMQLLGGAFRTEEIGPVDVKGKSEPVVAHRVLQSTTATSRRRDTPLFGRDAELGELSGLVQRVAGGVGGIGLLLGEAGIGKSRLVRATREAASDGAPLATAAEDDGVMGWLAGHARSYEHNVPHSLFVDVLRDWWGGTDDEGCFDRIAAAIERATGTSDPDTAGFLGALIGAKLPDDQRRLVDTVSAPVRHQRTTQAVVSYLRSEAARRPLLVVLQDLHWADAMTLALVEELMDATESAAIGLVLVMRPMREEPSWRLAEVADRDHGHRTRRIDLRPLDAAATEALLMELLAEVHLDDELRQDILDRASGNPLFIEEIVHSLGDRATEADRLGRGQVQVPPSLAGLLTARLDGLPEATRHVAQVASVIGRQFTRGTLERIVEVPDGLDDHLAELTRRGVVEERGTIPEPAYSFRHPLLQETAYSTVLRRTRRELHGRIADHLVEVDPDAVEPISTHYVEAGRFDAAFPHLVAAGMRAINAMALSDAFSAFTTALDNTPADADPDLVTAAHSGLGEAYSLVPDLSSASATYQSLLDYGRQMDRPAIQVAAYNRLGFSTAAIAGDFEGALGYLAQAKDLALKIGDDLGLAEYHMNACYVTSMQGNVDEAVEHDAATARIGETSGNEIIRLTGTLRKAGNLIATLRFDEAQEAYEQAMALAHELDNEELAAVLDASVRGAMLLRDGDLAGAQEILHQSIPTMDRYASYYGAGSHHRLAETHVLSGDHESALSEYAEAERYGHTLGQRWAVAAGAAGRARVLCDVGLLEGIDAVEEQALVNVHGPAGEFFGTSVLTDLGVAARLRGETELAAARLQEAVTTTSLMAQWEYPRVRYELVRVELAKSDVAAARVHVEQARTWLTEHRFRLREPELLLVDGLVATAEGRADDALALLEQAVGDASEVGLRPVVIEGLRGLAAVRRSLGDDGTADGLLHRASALDRELVSMIVDPTLRAAAQAKARVTTQEQS